MRDDRRDILKRKMEAILPGVLRDRGWEKQLALHAVFPHWTEIVDETTAAHTSPLKIVKGTLWVAVENSAWLQQLRFQKPVLLESINGFLKNESIKDIRFVLSQEEQKKEEEKRVRFSAPPGEEVKRFEEQVACIEDKAAREALIRLWYLSKACIRD